MNPETLSFDESKTLITDANATLTPGALDYYEGQHWNNGTGWVGPQFSDRDAASKSIMQEIEKVFTPQNITQEIVDRDVRGVLAKEPAWGLTVRRALKDGEQPNSEEQALIDEAEALATTWFDARQGFQTLNGVLQECSIHRVLKNACTRYRYGGRGPLRFVIPPGARNERGEIKVQKLEEAYKLIFFDAPSLDAATVALDSESMARIGVFHGVLQEREQIQLCYLAPNGNTVLRTIEGSQLEAAGRSGLYIPPAAILRAREEANRRASLRPEYPLNGHLLMLQMSGRSLVDDALLRIQKQLNKVCTITGRNLDTAGFVDEIIFNADAFDEVDDPAKPGATMLVSKIKRKGAGITNYLVGAVTEDADGRPFYANPSRDRAQPVDSGPIVEVAMFLYRCALQSKSQLHAFLSGDAVTSGEARKQALTDFIIALLDPKEVVEWALRWTIETYLQLVSVLSGEPGRFNSLRATADCRLYAGPLSSDDQRVLMELIDKKVLSLATGRSRLDIDDVDAENTLVEGEQKAQLAAKSVDTIPTVPATPRTPPDVKPTQSTLEVS